MGATERRAAAQAKIRRLAATTSTVLDGPVGLAGCGCPNRIDGSPPAVHICPECGFEDGVDSVHGGCAGCEFHARLDGLDPVEEFDLIDRMIDQAWTPEAIDQRLEELKHRMGGLPEGGPGEGGRS